MLKYLLLLLFVLITPFIAQKLCDAEDQNTCRVLTRKTFSTDLEFSSPKKLVIEGDASVTLKQQSRQLTAKLRFDRGIEIDGEIVASTIELYSQNAISVLNEGIVSTVGLGFFGNSGPGRGTCKDGCCGGGGYGGDGSCQKTGCGGISYGDVTGSWLYGSGSGGESGIQECEPGVPGGGRILLSSEKEILVYGNVVANGEDGIGSAVVCGSGGGSGGSIIISAPRVFGTGRIEANGGAGGTSSVCNGGHGGGGRVKIEAKEVSDKLIISARGGKKSGALCGGSGTVFFNESNTVILDSDNKELCQTTSMPKEFKHNIIVTEGANVVFREKDSLLNARSLTVGIGESRLYCEQDCTMNYVTTSILKDGILGSGATLKLDSDFVSVDGTIQSPTLYITSFDSVNVSSSGHISSDELGDESGEGVGKCTDNCCGGAGHAKHGAADGNTCDAGDRGGEAYGEEETPWTSGSRGGGGDLNCAPAGLGGGRIQIFAAKQLLIQGRVSADGAHGNAPNEQERCASGGSSGGSIQIRSDNVIGDGIVSAVGGAGGDQIGPKCAGGSASGGRIMISYKFQKNVFTDVRGGGSRCNAALEGTVFYKCFPGYRNEGSGCKACEPGHFCEQEGCKECEKCPPGKFSEKEGSPTCEDCPIGEIAPEEGSTKCEVCEAGWRWINATTDCEICPKHTYSPQPRSVECKDCEPGWIADREGASFCDPCDAGTYWKEKGVCEDCEKNTYSEQNSTQCIPCNIGYVSPPRASKCDPCPPGTEWIMGECIKCKPGYYNDQEAQTECKKCEPGSRSDEGAITCTKCPPGTKEVENVCEKCEPHTVQPEEGQTVCIDCEPGSIQPEEGQTQCNDCQPGEYWPEKGICKKCPKNHFSNTTRSLFCYKCEGNSTSEEGATKCGPCPAGKFYDKETGFCEECPENTYNPEAGGECKPCEPGSVSGRGAKECTKCSRGTHWTGPGNCEKCPKHTYQPEEGQTQCFDCEPGSIAEEEGATECTLCSAGTHWKEKGVCQKCARNTFQPKEGQTNCIKCEPGWVSEEGALKCEPCPPGTDARRGTCQKCVRGTYNDKWGAYECPKCADGEVSEEGALNCTACAIGEESHTGFCTPCPRNTFSKKPKTLKCEPCPENFVSIGGKADCVQCAPGNYWKDDKLETCTACPEGTYADAHNLIGECKPCGTLFTSKPGSSSCQLFPAVIWGSVGAGAGLLVIIAISGIITMFFCRAFYRKRFVSNLVEKQRLLDGKQSAPIRSSINAPPSASGIPEYEDFDDDVKVNNQTTSTLDIDNIPTGMPPDFDEPSIIVYDDKKKTSSSYKKVGSLTRSSKEKELWKKFGL